VQPVGGSAGPRRAVTACRRGRGQQGVGAGLGQVDGDHRVDGAGEQILHRARSGAGGRFPRRLQLVGVAVGERLGDGRLVGEELVEGPGRDAGPRGDGVELARQGFAIRTTLRDPGQEAGLRAMLLAQLGHEHPVQALRADLGGDAGWKEAVNGCDFVLHVASPFPAVPPADPDELIRPAREGTLRVLRAALEAGAERVVVTSSSSAAAQDPRHRGGPVTEQQWTDPQGPRVRAYARSKTLAERAAWDFMRDAGAQHQLAVVAPGMLLGPVLGDHLSYSVTAVDRMLRGATPGLPRLGFAVTDVRDVAALHLLAMTAPAAAGQRLLGTGPFLWFAEVAAILRSRLGEAAARVPTRQLPSLLVRAAAVFDPSIRQLLPELGRRTDFSAAHARTLLGWSPRPVEDTIVNCARSLLARGT
jgi:dihydroflavonol-4-reductase